jgi:hypothetical protein
MDGYIEGKQRGWDLHESTDESYSDLYFCFGGELDTPYGAYGRDNKEELEDRFDNGEDGPTSHLEDISND